MTLCGISAASAYPTHANPETAVLASNNFLCIVAPDPGTQLEVDYAKSSLLTVTFESHSEKIDTPKPNTKQPHAGAAKCRN